MSISRHIFVLLFGLFILSAPAIYTGCVVHEHDHPHDHVDVIKVEPDHHLARLLPFLGDHAARLKWSSSMIRNGLGSFATPVCFDDC